MSKNDLITHKALISALRNIQTSLKRIRQTGLHTNRLVKLKSARYPVSSTGRLAKVVSLV